MIELGNRMENLNKSTGILAMAATAFLWSIAGLFIKVIDWNPIAIAGVRSLIASIVILCYLKHPQDSFFISADCGGDSQCCNHAAVCLGQ